MQMNLVIREKRKEKGLTQEQVADYLGVSTPAVNKWEKGVTFPDITLLSSLARLLGIDLNTLFCFHENMTAQEIAYFNEEIMEIIRKSDFDSGFTLGMEKIKEYPNCAELIYSFALLMDGALVIYGTTVEDKESYQSEILNLYERVAKSDDEGVRHQAISMLTTKCIGDDEFEKAQEMINELPERNFIDKKRLQANLFRKQKESVKALEILERKLLEEVNEIQNTIMSLVDIELAEGNYNNAEHLGKIFKEVVNLFGLGDYSSYVILLQVAAHQKNEEESILLLKSMLSSLLKPWDIKKSPLYSHLKTKENKENLIMEMLPAILLEIENDPTYEFLHSNTEFQQLLKEYRNKML